MKEDQMTGQVEHADGTRGLDSFPREWGAPPGEPYSEERAGWVRRHAKLEQARNLDRPGSRRQTSASARLALAEALALTTTRDLALDTGMPVKKLSPAELVALVEQILADLKIASGQLP
jgi:hypothetical protein